MSTDMIADLPHLQRLALSYATRVSRPKWLALFALEARLAGIVSSAREPMLAQLKLAWWRDRLTSPQDTWPQGDVVLDALSEWHDPARLSPMVDSWEVLLDEKLTVDAVEMHIAGRASGFAVMSTELGADGGTRAVQAGRCFAQADLAANLASVSERDMVVGHVPPPDTIPALPRSLRPVSVLAGLGRSSLRKGGGPLLSGPGSVFLALRIGLSGR